jgi:hypothetical protein
MGDTQNAERVYYAPTIASNSHLLLNLALLHVSNWNRSVLTFSAVDLCTSTMAGGSDNDSESPDPDSQIASADAQTSSADDQSYGSVNVGRAVARRDSNSDLNSNRNSNPPQARGRLHRYSELGRELGRRLEVWKPYICSGCQRYHPANDIKPERDGYDWYQYDDEKRELIRVGRWMSPRQCGVCKLLTQLVDNHSKIDSKGKTCLLVPRMVAGDGS